MKQVQRYMVRDGEANIEFEGALLAYARERSACAPQEFRLYAVQGENKFVCTRSTIGPAPGERHGHIALVCETPAHVVEFFGRGRLAKLLYEAGPINFLALID